MDVISGTLGLSHNVVVDNPSGEKDVAEDGGTFVKESEGVRMTSSNDVMETKENVTASEKRKEFGDDETLATLISKGKKKKTATKKPVKDKALMEEEGLVNTKVPEKKKNKRPVKMSLNKKNLKAKPVEKDVSDILRDMEKEEEEPAHLESLSLASRKSIGGQKLPKDVPSSHLDNVSFHEEDRVRKWRYVYHIIVFPEKDCLRKF